MHKFNEEQGSQYEEMHKFNEEQGSHRVGNFGKQMGISFWGLQVWKSLAICLGGRSLSLGVVNLKIFKEIIDLMTT